MSHDPSPRPRRAWTWLRVWKIVRVPLILAFLGWFLYWGVSWGWDKVREPLPGPTPTPCATQTMKTLTSKQVYVGVYNGGTQRGLAGRVAGNLRSKGFKITTIANADDERIGQTVIRGGAADDPQVLLVAGFFVEPLIETDGRVDGTVDVFVGTQGPNPSKRWKDMKAKAPTKIAVKGGVVCLPATATPTPSTTPSPTAEG